MNEIADLERNEREPQPQGPGGSLASGTQQSLLEEEDHIQATAGYIPTFTVVVNTICVCTSLAFPDDTDHSITQPPDVDSDTEQRLLKTPVQATNTHVSSKMVVQRQHSWTVSTPDGVDGVDQNVTQNVLAVTEYHGKLATDSQSHGVSTQPVRVTTPAPSSGNSCGEDNGIRMVGGLQEMVFDDMLTAAEQHPQAVTPHLPIKEENNSGPAKLVCAQQRSWNVRIVEDLDTLGNNVAEHVLFTFRTNIYYTPCDNGDNKLPH